MNDNLFGTQFLPSGATRFRELPVPDPAGIIELPKKNADQKHGLVLGMPGVRLLPIFHYGRTGSTVLTNLLAKQPRICSLGEVFTPNCFLSQELEGSWWEAKRDCWPTRWRDPKAAYRASALLRKVIRTSSEIISSKPNVLFEVKFHSFVGGNFEALNAFCSVLRDFGTDDVVILHRHNLLRRLVSVLISMRSNVWHVKKNDCIPRPDLFLDPAAVLDPDFCTESMPLVRLLEETQQAIDEIESVIRRHFRVSTLTYEADLETDPARGAAYVANRILDQRYVPNTSDWVRQNGSPLDTLIRNYDEVRDVLRPTRFSHMAP